ncbi:MAG: type VI secretion system ATPase TssH [Verrucomicrobia bacterium]|nr:MAG: type VI secretion system ATPase TssH [Verrucomicrobiota bacterium]
MNVNLKSLIGKLNDTGRKALEAAAGLCVTRTHYDIDIEHLLLKLVELDNTDIQKILRHYEVDHARLTRDLTRALDRLKTGNARTPAFSPRIPRLVTEAWNLASIDMGANRVRSGHLLLALLGEENLNRLAREASPELQKVSVEELHKHFADLTTGTAEDEITSSEAREAAEPAALGPSKTPSLDQYTIDLTNRARKGQIDPVLGRDFEIRQMVDILTRRRQNNPILTGEAGVGKTAVVEGLALRIAAGDVPGPLHNVALKTLDLTLLQAGAGVKGEFENRLKSVIEEVKASPQPIILFIDEAHTMIGAGGQAGQGDAANILKPALARGELRTIAATTWAEYKKYFEKDAALTRRFQVVKVDEPTEEQAVAMLRGLMSTLESHHNVRILDEAMDAAVRLSHRYITGRQLPDKAVSVLDTSSARIALGQMTTPPALEDCHRRISLIETEMGILERESLTGGNTNERIDILAKEKADIESRLTELDNRWNEEKKRVEELRGLREKLEAHAAASKKGGDGKTDGQLSPDEVKRVQDEIRRLNGELGKIQGESPLIQVCVDAQAVAEVVSGWTGIPVGKVLKDEIQTVLSLKDRLEERIIGQSHALEAIAQRIRTARAKLEDPRRPIGVFMLVGPSGVGKTETALALADTLFGGERNVVVINMSEYQEGHTVSGLKGSPPGYVGYGEGGVLTEAVRRKPYCVVLLDEMEKAHTDVMELFYQVFDKGMLEDGEGREIDFKNTLILMTSNAGTDTIAKLCADPDTKPEPEALADALRPDLLKVFKPAFLGRAIIVPYYPIADDIMKKIIELQLGRIQKRLFENHRAQFSYDRALVDEVARRCTEVESGARNVDHILTRTLLPEISKEFLARMASGDAIGRVHITVGNQGGFQYEIS